MSCNCGSGKSYASCCEIAHQDITQVKTAEQLMRSRYTAFTLAYGDYLMESHHVSTRPLSEKAEIVAWAKSVEWDKLEVKSTNKGLENDKEGTVKFKAHFKENGKQRFIKENSKFIKENGVWYYLGLA
ncbi:MAG: YchJ family metal-binding protein [Vicingaceae bacterium]|nr:YchJ family metal-binding protein [Vicingaceae bacterium]